MIDIDAARIGYDVTFELDEFGKPRLQNPTELVKNIVLFICFTKPGQYPSLPHIGLDLESMLYSFYDEIDEEDLKQRIVNQCHALGLYFNTGYINIRKTIYRKQPSLMIHIQADSSTTNSTSEANKYQIGITYDEFNNMIYNIA